MPAVKIHRLNYVNIIQTSCLSLYKEKFACSALDMDLTQQLVLILSGYTSRNNSGTEDSERK